MAKKNQRVLVIGDMHIPFHHKDSINFLKAIKSQYNPDRIISIGDLLDWHSASFHVSSQELHSAGDELKIARKYVKVLSELFPVMDILTSNHEDIPVRKLKHHGLPLDIMKDYRDVIGAPKTWNYYDELVIKMSDGRECMFHHGLGSNVSKVSQNYGCSFIQGHYHTKFWIDYWVNHKDIFFAAQTGCLVDLKSYAFEYAKNNFKKFILGSLIIIDGQPKLLPMVLNKSGRWTKKLV